MPQAGSSHVLLDHLPCIRASRYRPSPLTPVWRQQLALALAVLAWGCNCSLSLGSHIHWSSRRV